ncbi:hypothetical protein K504DRAFT_34883 [Pleomassaria siparia CBS 279.74]|uniref:Uncharacterized protein n=1 Tax=Pleomassaria siparia CBS 279.74 TaxID=1314801 RepID=A0A6G1KT25_9PLEO|nr:hypothetical protein K504DRAFT_34883 [Pleomassaria siparia CBS 279.74]
MAAIELAGNISDHPVDQDTSRPRQHASRRDTQSTTSSGKQALLSQPGLYLLHLHGNCPRCHHRHKAAAIEFRITGDQASPINCEKCGSPWLAVGGNNTSWSLLSAQTIELDAIETSFRSTLVAKVKSLTTGGLASVPELPSGGTSRNHSLRSRHETTDRKHQQQSHLVGDIIISKLGHPTTPHERLPKGRRCSSDTTKPKKYLAFLAHLKDKLQDRWPKITNLQGSLK